MNKISTAIIKLFFFYSFKTHWKGLKALIIPAAGIAAIFGLYAYAYRYLTG